MTTTPADSPIRILHLSDFHFSTRSQWDADPILRALAGFIATDAAEHDLYPDLVIITGDLAQSGKPTEYKLARQWLDELWPRLTPDPATPLPRDRLLLVPGNHDVDWNRIEPGARDAHQALLAAKTQEAVTERLQSNTTRELLFKRHTAYLKCYGDWLGQRQTLPWWQRRIVIRDQRLHVAGLDSAWLAGGDDDSRLLLGTYQINQTVLHREGEGDCDWRIALLHHPWASLAEFDRNDAQRTLHRHRDLVLRGHLHQPDLVRLVPADPRRSCIEAAAGCCYSGKPYPNAFQWIELSRDPRRVRFHFRFWNQDDWQVDRNQPGCPEGTHTIDLSAAAGAVRASPHPTRKDDRQVDTHLPGCPDGTQRVLLPIPADAEQVSATLESAGPVTDPTVSANGQPDGRQSTLTKATLGNGAAVAERDQTASRTQLESVSPPAPQLRVFISYAQHSHDHSAAVLALAEALSADGIAVELDQFHAGKMLHWPTWCAEQLHPKRSDFVLMVCSAEYRRRIENQVNWDQGRGVFWEGRLIYNALYNAKDNKRYIPVLLDDEPDGSIPDVMQGWPFFRLRGFGTADPEYSKLLQLITKQAARPVSATDPTADLPRVDQAARPNPDPQLARAVPARRPAPLPEYTEQEIAKALSASPRLCAALARELRADQEATPTVIARRLCDPAADAEAVLNAQYKAVEALRREVRGSAQEGDAIRENARLILGWTTIATVVEGYEREDGQRLVQEQWFDGTVFRFPLGRNPCVEILTARWRNARAQFGTEPATAHSGEDEITPPAFPETGINPDDLSAIPEVEFIYQRVYEKVYGKRSDRKLTRDLKDALRETLNGWKTLGGRRLRLVIDAADPAHAYAADQVLAAIHAALGDLYLIRVDGNLGGDPGVFILAPAKLTARITMILDAIKALP